MQQHKPTQARSKDDEWPELLAAIKQVDPTLASVVDSLANVDAVQAVAQWRLKHGLAPVEAVDEEDYQRERQQVLKSILPELARLGRADLVVRLKTFVADADQPPGKLSELLPLGTLRRVIEAIEQGEKLTPSKVKKLGRYLSKLKNEVKTKFKSLEPEQRAKILSMLNSIPSK